MIEKACNIDWMSHTLAYDLETRQRCIAVGIDMKCHYSENGFESRKMHVGSIKSDKK